MRGPLLVWPVSVGRDARPQRMRDRLVPAVLRLVVAASRAAFGGRGVAFACTTGARLLGSGGRLSFRLGGGGSFLVPVDDRYWLQPLLLDRCYELDIDHFLRRALMPHDIFLDCGANLGLWSIASAQVIQDPKRVLAVEASSRTFSSLVGNWEANNRSFTVLHRALSDVTGSEVSFFASAEDHASATLMKNLSPADAQSETVSTVSLLDLLPARISSDPGNGLVFVKLDVEGMERQVLSMINPEEHGRVVVLYEDHARDTSHVTAFLLERGFAVAFMADDGSFEPIRLDALQRLAELKLNPRRGYNLLAVAARGAAASRLSELYPTLKLVL